MSISSFTEYKRKQANINEGFFDRFFGKKGGNSAAETPSKGEVKKSAGFFSQISNIFGFNFGGDQQEDTKKDPIEAAMDEVMKNAEAGQEKRMNDLMTAREKAMVGKIKAADAMQQSQLDIRNAKHVNAYNAYASRMAELQKIHKANKTHMYSQEQMATMVDSWEKDLASLGGGPIQDAAQKVKDIAMQIMIDENGNVRSQDEQKKFLNGENNKKLLDEYNEAQKIVGDYNKVAGKTLTADELVDAIGKKYDHICGETVLNNSVDTELKNVREVKDNLEKIHTTVENYGKYKEEEGTLNGKIEDLEGQISDLGTKIDKLKNGNDEKMFEVLEEDFKKEWNQQNLEPNVDDSEEEKNRKDAAREELLKKYGLPETLKTTMDSVSTSLKDLTPEQKSAVKKKMKERIDSLEEIHYGLISENNIAHQQLKTLKDQNADVIKKYDEIVAEEKEKGGDQYTEEAIGADLKNRFTDQHYEDELQQFKDEEKRLDEKKKFLERQKEIRKKQREEAASRSAENSVLDVDAMTEVNQKLDDINEFETICTEEGDNYGKIGFYDDKGKFVPRPEPDAYQEDKDEYWKNKSRTAASMDLDKLKPVEVTKDENGKYYITGPDGEKKEVDREAAITSVVNNKNNAQIRERVMGIRLDAMKAYTQYCEDGKISDQENFNKLPEAVKASVEIINNDYNETRKKIEENNKTLEELKKESDDSEASREALEELEKDNEKIRKDFEDRLRKDFGNPGVSSSDPIKVVIKDLKEYEEYVDDDDTEEYEDNLDQDDENTNDEDMLNDDGSKYDPRKVWKRRKKKNGNEMTKNYYYTKGTEKQQEMNITPEEYKEKMEKYKKNHKKRGSDNSSQESTPDNDSGDSINNDNNSHISTESLLANYLIKNLKSINEHLKSL